MTNLRLLCLDPRLQQLASREVEGMAGIAPACETEHTRGGPTACLTLGEHGTEQREQPLIPVMESTGSPPAQPEIPLLRRQRPAT